jgi:hypothetical protein
MKATYPRVTRDGQLAMIEARTMEEADLAAEQACGPGWRTVYVQRVNKGGFAGFFSTEVVELVASPAARVMTAPAYAEDLLSALGPDGGDFADRMMVELRASEANATPAGTAANPAATPATPQRLAPVAAGGARPRSVSPEPHVAPAVLPSTFTQMVRAGAAPAPLAHMGEFEREFIAPETLPWVSAAAVPKATRPHRRVDASEASTVEGSRHGQAAPSDTGLAWSSAALLVLGLPESLVENVLAARPTGDEEWTAALMLALRDLVGAEPRGPVIIIGPHAAQIAGLRHVTVVATETLGKTDGSVGVVTHDPSAVAGAANGRAFHLVVGGAWSTLAGLRPAAVTASSLADLPAALRIAAAWSVRVAAVRTSDGLQPADAVGSAMAIRSLLLGSVGLARSPWVADTRDGARPAP